ncbi:MAG: adenine deaminase [Kurthia sp.]|nr:adenine deaminase [Candidatus Kurthia equi]
MKHPNWKIFDIREQIAVIDGKKSPSKVIINARYLHSIFKKWVEGNIWILDDRIVYAGPNMPPNMDDTEVIDASGKTIVPGYIEPHVHPYQLYNPLTLADYAAQTGTTTFLSDNLTLFLSLKNEEAFHILDQLKERTFHFYWWMRYDSQTELIREHNLFTSAALAEWGARQDVLMGGELTGWPRLLAGDDQMLYWIQASRANHKKIETHLPGASSRTLARLKLFGADGDHEAMTIEEVENRILHGYAVTLRHSSIRPDLPQLLKDVVERELDIFDHLMMTTDGATPAFYEDGIMDKCIQVALDAGVEPIQAYQMASYNVANYYDVTHVHGLIATGRFATLNFLEDEFHPTPTDVLSKGEWLKRDNQRVHSFEEIEWGALQDFTLDVELTDEDFQFSMPFGIEMVNDVITKPYSTNLHTNDGVLSNGHDECYLMLVDKEGKWRVNTLIKGFATSLQGFATSYSCTGDIILIGKSIQAMHQAFNEMKKMGGGIVIVEDGEVISSIPLKIGGMMSDEPLEKIMVQEKALKLVLKERGFVHGDAIYTLLFLQSTHLPYIRITQRGIFDVMKKQVLFPSVMR